MIRIDYMPGMERLRMWVDPGTDHPMTPADIDTPIEDHRWNEIRLQSGEPAVGIHGYHFDTIVIDTPTVGLGTDVCNGDGGNQMGCTDCPCGNNAMPGTVGGCLNSVGTSARLLPMGSERLMNMDLCFEMEGGKPDSFAVLTSGDALAPANAMSPCFGLDSGIQSVALDGLRCVVQNVLRHGSRAVDSTGYVGANGTPPEGAWGFCSSNFPNSGGFMAGQTSHFQAIYREDMGVSCGTEQNTSQAVSITFTM